VKQASGTEENAEKHAFIMLESTLSSAERQEAIGGI
jgi:hypothetical protein